MKTYTVHIGESCNSSDHEESVGAGVHTTLLSTLGQNLFSNIFYVKLFKKIWGKFLNKFNLKLM